MTARKIYIIETIPQDTYQEIKFKLDNKTRSGMSKAFFFEAGKAAWVNLQETKLGIYLLSPAIPPVGLDFEISERLKIMELAVNLCCAYLQQEQASVGARRIIKQLNVFYEEICHTLAEGIQESSDEVMNEKSAGSGENKSGEVSNEITKRDSEN